MKTTVYLDDDLVADLKTQANEAGTTFRAVLNETLRKGLQAPLNARTKPFRTITYRMGKAGKSGRLDKALNLSSELENEEVISELDKRK